jgi:hypothetical protein
MTAKEQAAAVPGFTLSVLKLTCSFTERDDSRTEINDFGFTLDEVQLECQKVNRSQMLWSTL